MRFSRVQPDGSVASTACIRNSASLLPTRQGSGRAASTLGAAAAGSVGSNGGFKGSRFWTGGVPHRDGMLDGVVEVVAGGTLCSGIVELRPGCDEARGFQLLQRSHHPASPSTGFDHQSADRRIARKSLSALMAKRCKTNFVVGEPMSDSVAQSSAFQLMFAVWAKPRQAHGD